MLTLVPIEKWPKANTNLLVISLNRKTRKYKEQLIRFESDEAVLVQNTNDYLTNTRLLFSMDVNEFKKQLAKTLVGNEHYFYLIKAHESETLQANVPYRCLIAEQTATYFNHTGALTVNPEINHGFIICQQDSSQSPGRLSNAVLAEPNIHSDFVNNQIHLISMMRNYCDHIFKIERVELS